MERILWQRTAFFTMFALIYTAFALLSLGAFPDDSRHYINGYEANTADTEISLDKNRTQIILTSIFLWMLPLGLQAMVIRSWIPIMVSRDFPMLKSNLELFSSGAFMLYLLITILLLYSQFFAHTVREINQWANLINVTNRLYHMLIGITIVGCALNTYYTRIFSRSVTMLILSHGFAILMMALISLGDFQLISGLLISMIEVICAIVVASYLLIRVNAK